MTTTTLDKIPLDEITQQAREVKPGRTVLTVIAAFLFGIGWVTAKVFAVAWLGAMWTGVAVREGWRASHGPSKRERMAAQAQEIADLRASLNRFSG